MRIYIHLSLITYFSNRFGIPSSLLSRKIYLFGDRSAFTDFFLIGARRSKNRPSEFTRSGKLTIKSYSSLKLFNPISRDH